MHKQRFCDSQIVIITNFVLILSVGVKSVVCTTTFVEKLFKHSRYEGISGQYISYFFMTTYVVGTH